MNPQEMLKQMVEFQKTTFDNSYQALTTLQNQTEKVVKGFVDQATWLPKEGRDVIENWLDTYGTGRQEFKKVVDESFDKVIEMLTKEQ
jgi:hypothetical protein